jgi:lantibiotic biosynthesis protein
MQQKSDNILNHIAETLYQTIKDKKDGQFEKIGLMDGMSGVALFYAYYSKYNTKYGKLYFQIIEEIIEIIDSNNISLHYCDGITGFAWLLEHLVQHDFIEADDANEVIDNFDEMITFQLNKEIKNQNFDFLYGTMGIGNYFLQRNKRKDCSAQLGSITNALKQYAIKDKIGIKWKSTLKPELNVYNYGFAHGQISIIAFLNKLIKSNPSNKDEIIKFLLDPAIKHLFSKGIYDDKRDGNRFIPINMLDVTQNEKEKLMKDTWGWCYGDLVIGWTLNNSVKILNDSKLSEKVTEIMVHSCERKSLKLNHIEDAHFCHGAASIFHIFNKYTLENDNTLYRETLDYWLNQLLDLLKSQEDNTGYKYYDEGNWENRYFLLHGDAGVALTLLSYLKPELMAWDACFLLS